MSNILKDTLNKQPLICAEGYLFEMERRGYLTSGEFVPEVALEHPGVLENPAGSSILLPIQGMVVIVQYLIHWVVFLEW